jgi:hypothetical protein
MLICQKGLSAGMAWAITAEYPTLYTLKRAYNRRCQDEDEKERLVAGIPYDNGRKKIPLSASKTLSWLFNEKEFI